jgi:hypothetical protein
MIMRATHPYPFPISPHTIWILRQVLDRPRQLNLGDGEIFIVNSFNEIHEPVIENDFYTCEILKYLEHENIIRLHNGNRNGIKEFTLPLPGKPTHSMVAEWEVSLLNQHSLVGLLKKVAYRATLATAARRDRFHCRFEMDDDNILWMKTEIGRFPLRKLNFGLTSYRVMLTLCEEGFVELTETGEIAGHGRYAGTKVKSLQECLRGIGFNKMLKDSFFETSTESRIKLKSPPPAFNRSFHDAIIEQFEESSQIRHKLNSNAITKRKIFPADR